MPMEYFVLSLRVVVYEKLMEEALIEILLDLEQLDEAQLHVAYGMKVEKLRRKKWLDQNLLPVVDDVGLLLSCQAISFSSLG